MLAVLLTIHIVACIAMIVTILLQRSEGGGLGLGTGGGVGNMMTGRGAANALTRATVICAAIFITTSISLALLAKASRGTSTLITPGGTTGLPTAPLPGLPTAPLPSSPAPAAPESGVPTAPSSAPSEPSAIPVPAAPAPATPAPAAPTGAQPAPTPASPPPAGGGQ